MCRVDCHITVDGSAKGEARTVFPQAFLARLAGLLPDHQERSLLMNEAVSESFDGPYFGMSQMSAVIGTAYPIWTRDR